MKKFLKQILTITLSVMMILAAIPVQAAAPSYLTEEQDDHSVYGKNCKTYDVSENMAWLFCIRSGQS